MADAYFNIGHVLFTEDGDQDVVMAHIDTVVARYRDLDDERGAAKAAWGRGIAAMQAGHLDGATDFLTESLATFDRLDERQYHAMTTASLGWAAFAGGDVATASRLAVASLIESQSMRDLGTTTISLHIGVLLGALTGHFEEAAEIHGAFDALCDRYGVRPPAALETFVGRQDPFAMTKKGLDPDVWSAAYEQGRRLTLDEAVALVVTLGESAGILDGPSRENA